MKLFLELYENEPMMLYTSTDKITVSNNDKTSIEEITVPDDISFLKDDEGLSSLYVIFHFPCYRIFDDLIELLNFIQQEDCRFVAYRCSIDIFRDCDMMDIKTMTTMPIDFIVCLESKYRIYNKNMTREECFQEAVSMWKIFGPQDICILRKLANRYPIYEHQYEHHFKQHDWLVGKTEWKSRDQFMNMVYP